MVLTNLTSDQSGSYTVEVSNSYGSVTSAEANLLIVEPPSLSIDETQQMHLTGASGVTYQIQFLDQAGGEQAWQPLFEVNLPIDVLSPDTRQATFRDESAPETQRFYRAMVLPVPAVSQ